MFYDYENDQESILAQNLVALSTLVIAIISAYFKIWPIVDGFLKQISSDYQEPPSSRNFPTDLRPVLKLVMTTGFFAFCVIYKQVIIRFGRVALSRTVGLLRLSNEEFEQ